MNQSETTAVAEAREALIAHAQETTLEHMRAISRGEQCCAQYVDAYRERVLDTLSGRISDTYMVERVAVALRVAFGGLDGAVSRDDWRTMASAAIMTLYEEAYA